MRRRKMLAFVLTFAMILSAFLGYLPSFSKKSDGSRNTGLYGAS